MVTTQFHSQEMLMKRFRLDDSVTSATPEVILLIVALRIRDIKEIEEKLFPVYGIQLVETVSSLRRIHQIDIKICPVTKHAIIVAFSLNHRSLGSLVRCNLRCF